MEKKSEKVKTSVVSSFQRRGDIKKSVVWAGIFPLAANWQASWKEARSFILLTAMDIDSNTNGAMNWTFSSL